MEDFVREKRDELIWALDKQGLNYRQIGDIFNGLTRSTVMRIVEKRPRGWTPKWVKREN